VIRAGAALPCRTSTRDADRRYPGLATAYSVQPVPSARRSPARQPCAALRCSPANRRGRPAFALQRMPGHAEPGDAGQSQHLRTKRVQATGDRHSGQADATAIADVASGDRTSLDFDDGVGPGRLGQVIRLHPKTGQRHRDWLTWGLIPLSEVHSGSEAAPIHARAETVAQLPRFADAFRHGRAIVPAAEYYQRRTIGGAGKRYAITRRDGQPLAIAGVWEAFRRTDGEIVRTYCIVTVQARGTVAEIPDRMPLVLDEIDWPVWFGRSSWQSCSDPWFALGGQACAEGCERRKVSRHATGRSRTCVTSIR
jgi:putative SOS response-associated peptidase YedK